MQRYIKLFQCNFVSYSPAGKIRTGCNVEVCPPAVHARGFLREFSWPQPCRDSADFLARAEASFHSLFHIKDTRQFSFSSSLLSLHETRSSSRLYRKEKKTMFHTS